MVAERRLLTGASERCRRVFFSLSCHAAMASPVKRFEIRQLVNEVFDEKLSGLTSKLHTFEQQQDETFKALETATVTVQNKMSHAEERVDGASHRVGEAMGAADNNVQAHEAALHKTIEEANKVMMELTKRISYIEKLLGEAQEKQ